MRREGALDARERAALLDSDALFREVAGQGPEKTQRRGFAVVRDSACRPVVNVGQARAADGVEIQFQDGVIAARNLQEEKAQ